MCHWEQLHFCKLTQPKARFRPAEDGVFEILLYSCKLEALWAAAQNHSQWICCFPKLWKALLQSIPYKERELQKSFIAGLQLQDWIHSRLDVTAGTISDIHLLSNLQAFSTVKSASQAASNKYLIPRGPSDVNSHHLMCWRFLGTLALKISLLLCPLQRWLLCFENASCVGTK